MKKLLVLSIFLLNFSLGSMAQNSEGIHEFNKFMSKNLQYGSELRSERIEGPVTFVIQFDESGKLKQNPMLVAGNKMLEEEVTRTFDKLIAEGSPALVGPEYFGQEYLLTVQFKLAGTEKTGFYIPERSESAAHILEKLNKKIAENPYFVNYYKERAAFYENMGNSILADLDKKQIELLESKQLTTILVVGYNSTRKSLSAE
ncbi:hypothetical protein SAMN04488519_103370 [Algoriphagus ornithinivorans]|uniref:TonB protein C-terminal n=1 Tax=Algoriphagus ornithinivorans TaxID=226506 RepID=A0A1I5EAW6_9BACT|nr:hypothetical protein [Algoriphagus ornithinivorans]SFO08679.1 hypothetical protein SAMN04488519_103370 [Algoriphagus ornithinivorans]